MNKHTRKCFTELLTDFTVELIPIMIVAGAVVLEVSNTPFEEMSIVIILGAHKIVVDRVVSILYYLQFESISD